MARYFPCDFCQQNETELVCFRVHILYKCHQICINTTATNTHQVNTQTCKIWIKKNIRNSLDNCGYFGGRAYIITHQLDWHYKIPYTWPGYRITSYRSESLDLFDNFIHRWLPVTSFKYNNDKQCGFKVPPVTMNMADLDLDKYDWRLATATMWWLHLGKIRNGGFVASTPIASK